MTDLFLERKYDPPMTPGRLFELQENGRECLDMHRVDWIRSWLSADGSRMFCWFRAHDMESARIAMRQLEVDLQLLWAGTVHDNPGSNEEDIETANVVVERTFDKSTPLQTIQAIEDGGIQCLEAADQPVERALFATHPVVYFTRTIKGNNHLIYA